MIGWYHATAPSTTLLPTPVAGACGCGEVVNRIAGVVTPIRHVVTCRSLSATKRCTVWKPSRAGSGLEGSRERVAKEFAKCYDRVGKAPKGDRVFIISVANES